MISFDCEVKRAAFTFDVAFQAGAGITALFGPSGSGKSTAIRLLAGLETPERGRIAIDETVLLDTAARRSVPSHRRRIGLVFQDAQLLPHLSVKANLNYGRWFTPTPERRISFQSVVEVLGIELLLSRSPDTLSGGERQRVAIGRALLTSPQLLLMDEPLASLDLGRKLEILPFIERLRDEYKIPIIYVSHAIEEVLRLSEHVVRLENGRVTATGTATEILPLSSSMNAAGRFETFSIVTGVVERYRPDYDITVIRHPAGSIVVPGQVTANPSPTRILIGATNVTLAKSPGNTTSIRTALAGTVTAILSDRGPFALVTIRLTGGESLQAYTTRLAIDTIGLTVGDAAQALVKSVSIDERGVQGLV